MGNCCCCQSKGPCDSAEETSLLQNDSKATVPTAETPGALSVGGTCGPGLEEDISKGQLNKDAETAYSAQENGTLQKSSLQTANKSPQHKVNSANAQSVDKHASTADSGDGGQQHSTLITPQKGHAQAGWEASKTTSAEEDKAVEEKKCPSETPAVVCTEPPCLSETNPKQEHSIMDAINNNKQECPVPLDICVERSSTEPEEVKEEEELPNAEPAAPHPQVLPISEINEEVNVVNTEPSISDDPESRSSPVCVEADHEETQSHVPEPSVGSLGPGFDHSGPEGETAKPEPDTTVSAESQSLQQTEKCHPECPVKDTPHEIAAVSPEEDVKPEEEVPGVVCEGKPEETLEEAESAAPAVATVAEEVMVVREEQLAESAPALVGGDTEPEETPVTAKEEAAEDRGNSEEDLYRGAEELSCDLTTTSAAASENSLRSEDRCSLAPAVDILSYSEREWKGNTAKSALIRKGYKEMSHKFSGVRRVRGDNYCALRATLYQVLCHTTQMPEWLQEEGVATLPKELEAREGLISPWIFPGECLLHEDGTLDATQQLQGYIELLREKWQAAVACASSSERQQLCEQWFQGGEQELGLMEALKVLMLARAVELHSSIQQGDDPPLFCWLLFARDSSDCPRSFLNNHLSHVGLSAGLEQVEMFLLGYALQCTIQVYRLYKADTEEFVTFYPDDHKDEWPCVCLVTEDDRHYNVPVLLDATEPPKELKSS